MATFTQLVVLSAMLAVACCHPLKFGAGGSLSSHTTFGGDATGQIGGEGTDLVSGRGRGYANWVGTSKGGAYFGETGAGGELSSSLGGQVRGRGGAGASGGSDDGYTAYGGGNGSLDGRVHGNVFGDVHGYSGQEIQDLNRKGTHHKNQASWQDQREGYGVMKSDYDW